MNNQRLDFVLMCELYALQETAIYKKKKTELLILIQLS